MVPAAAEALRLNIYVSFSGSDLPFAEKVIVALRTDGKFKVTIDPDSMIDEENWKAFVYDLISDADAVVFILSPESAGTCTWEVECAHRLSKRIVPVLCRPPVEIAMPKRLTGLKYVQFGGEQSFARDLSSLTVLLNKNIGWLREHTRLFTLARKWHEAGQPDQLLLTGEEIFAAKMWTLDRPEYAPKPTDLHLKYISTSEAADTRRQNAAPTMQVEFPTSQVPKGVEEQNPGSKRWPNRVYMAVASVLIITGLVAGWQTADARRQAADARKQAAEADQKALTQHQAAQQSAAALAAQDKRAEDGLNKVNASLCREARRVTSVLGTSSDDYIWDSNYYLFWTLHEGPMMALGQFERTSSAQGRSAVAEAMIEFGEALGKGDDPKQARKSGLPRPRLLARARNVADACAKYADAN